MQYIWIYRGNQSQIYQIRVAVNALRINVASMQRFI